MLLLLVVYVHDCGPWAAPNYQRGVCRCVCWACKCEFRGLYGLSLCRTTLDPAQLAGHWIGTEENQINSEQVCATQCEVQCVHDRNITPPQGTTHHMVENRNHTNQMRKKWVWTKTHRP